MAAPTPVTITDPTAVNGMLRNGYRALLNFAVDTDISLWIKSVTPPAFDMGESINITTMHNDDWESKTCGALADLGDINFTAGYEAMTLSQIFAIKGQEGACTLLFPSNRTLTFFGYLKSFTASELVNRAHPVGTGVVVVTNFDPSGLVEAGPVFGTNA